MRAYRLLREARLEGKRVLLRAGFDLPIVKGVVTDDTRLRAILPTMRFILDHGGVLILLAHQGRPADCPDPKFSQFPLVPVLEKLLKTTVHFSRDCIGPASQRIVSRARPGEVVLLENLRFYAGEKRNDSIFAKALAAHGDIYVNDAFTNSHRNHASMVSVPTMLPAFMGCNLEQEIAHLSSVSEQPTHPVTLIVSGAKMETKLPVLRRFLRRGDHILLGGCIANTFIAARGFSVGHSAYEEHSVAMVQELMLESEKKGRAMIHVPRDVVVASKLSEEAAKIDIPVEDIEGDMSIYDIGKVSVSRYIDIIEQSKTIIWNGPLGVYEYNRFSHASKRIAEAVVRATSLGALSIVGGGDTIDFHHKYAYSLSAYTFVSMGGGAMLEFLAGEKFLSLKLLEKA